MPNNVKNTTFPTPLDLIAPHSCRGCGQLGNVLCECCKNNIISHRQNYCPNCKSILHSTKCPDCQLPYQTFVVDERSNLIGDLVHDYKYHSIRALAKPLAEILDATLPNLEPPVFVVPLPTSSSHIRARSFDHINLIAKHLVKLRGANYQITKLLIRNKNTVQVGADRTTRLTQAETAYQLNPKLPINQQATYLLLDDVWTTGASIQAAVKKLRQAGVNHLVVAILALSRID